MKENFPGIAKYGCTDPYNDYVEDSYKCENCERNKRCSKELETIYKVLDNYGKRKKKPTKPKSKRKCRCKK